MESDKQDTGRDVDFSASRHSPLATRHSFPATRHSFLSYAQLVRLPLVFSAIANVAMGYLLVHESLAPTCVFLLLVLSSVSLYWSGMILNDVYDYTRDVRQRPERPLPSGRISVSSAMRLGWALLALGVAAAWTVCYWEGERGIRAGMVALLLALCIVLYDRVLKSTVVGPLVMGACRMFNVLLGMSTGAWHGGGALIGWTGYGADQWCIAGGIGLLVAGLTWVARSETQADNRDEMIFGLTVMLAAFLVLGAFPFTGRYAMGQAVLVVSPPSVWLMLLALLGFSVIRPVLAVVLSPSPVPLQAAIRHGLLSLIVLDAAICLVARQPFGWSLGILALLVPSMILGRWLYST